MDFLSASETETVQRRRWHNQNPQLASALGAKPSRVALRLLVGTAWDGLEKYAAAVAPLPFWCGGATAAPPSPASRKLHLQPQLFLRASFLRGTNWGGRARGGPATFARGQARGTPCSLSRSDRSQVGFRSSLATALSEVEFTFQRGK